MARVLRNSRPIAVAVDQVVQQQGAGLFALVVRCCRIGQFADQRQLVVFEKADQRGDAGFRQYRVFQQYCAASPAVRNRLLPRESRNSRKAIRIEQAQAGKVALLTELFRASRSAAAPMGSCAPVVRWPRIPFADAVLSQIRWCARRRSACPIALPAPAAAAWAFRQQIDRHQDQVFAVERDSRRFRRIRRSVLRRTARIWVEAAQHFHQPLVLQRIRHGDQHRLARSVSNCCCRISPASMVLPRPTCPPANTRGAARLATSRAMYSWCGIRLVRAPISPVSGDCSSFADAAALRRADAASRRCRSGRQTGVAVAG